MKYRMGAVAEITGGELIGSARERISDLLLDSRKSTTVHEVLFVALRGAVHDGHHYVPELYHRGMRHFLVEELPPEPLPDAHFVKVKDSLKALQKLAAFHRSQFHYPVVAITGSNGKTVVKEWLHQLLHQDVRIVRSPKSYNSQVGVPLSMWTMRADHQMALIEAGISQPGEMSRLERIIKPTHGLFTMLGHAHAEFFESPEQKLAEKLKLFRSCQDLYYCKDQEAVHKAMLKLGKKGRRLHSWSRKDQDAELYVKSIRKRGTKSQAELVWKGETFLVELPFATEASLDNAFLCCVFLLDQGLDPKQLMLRTSQLEPIAMRLELLEGLHGNLLINDAYNSDPESVAIALEFLRQQKQKMKRVLVLSDLQQSGTDTAELYRQISKWLADYEIDEFIGIGPEISASANLFPSRCRFFSGTDAFLRALPEFNWKNRLILLKGARLFRFERILDTLQQQTHDTVLEVNLTALLHNLNYYRAQLKPKTKLMAMVKAFSYGSGSAEIAAALQFHKVDYLAVAYADEGVQLRQAGIDLPIMVMNPDEASFGAILQYRLEPEIYSFRILERFLRHLVRTNYEGLRFPIHLKLDTGMHRLGFEEADLGNLAAILKAEPGVEVRSVFSHLAAADEEEHREFTAEQIALFQHLSGALEKVLGYPVIRHVLNSSGIHYFPEAQMDMVRLGIGLYGITSDPEERSRLRPVGRLRSIISQIKLIRKGESVGYSRSFIAGRDMRIGTVALGYADGLRRTLSNGVGVLYTGGKPVPIIGKVCMDMCMVDLSEVNVREGDEVEVFGPNLSVYEMAERMQTIPYEVLTSISQRVKRVYFQEG